MPNAKDLPDAGFERILLVGPTGGGKTAQIWTLRGKKFAYIFDPNSLRTLRGCDLDYEEFYPELSDVDLSFKRFNKDGRSDDKMPGRAADKSPPEPKLFNDWLADFNERSNSGYFDKCDWVIFDSLTFLVKAAMDRNLWINKRFGALEDIADYRIVGSKLGDIFRTVSGMDCNLMAMAHQQTWQDDITKKIETVLYLPGGAKTTLPLMFTNIWLMEGPIEGEPGFWMRTVPDPRGLKTVRSAVRDLPDLVDVTIRDWSRPHDFGIQAVLDGKMKKKETKK